MKNKRISNYIKVIKKFFTSAVSTVLAFSLVLQTSFVAFADTTSISEEIVKCITIGDYNRYNRYMMSQSDFDELLKRIPKLVEFVPMLGRDVPVPPKGFDIKYLGTIMEHDGIDPWIPGPKDGESAWEYACKKENRTHIILIGTVVVAGIGSLLIYYSVPAEQPLNPFEELFKDPEMRYWAFEYYSAQEGKVINNPGI